jgi:hypothetical protein
MDVYTCRFPELSFRMQLYLTGGICITTEPNQLFLNKKSPLLERAIKGGDLNYA